MDKINKNKKKNNEKQYYTHEMLKYVVELVKDKKIGLKKLQECTRRKGRTKCAVEERLSGLGRPHTPLLKYL